MFRFLSRRKAPLQALQRDTDAAVPEGVRVYAIGDVHGRLDLLDDLLDQISVDHQSRGGGDVRLVFVGDLIDRGPDSAGVIDRVRELMHQDSRISCIMGNHEEVFLLALRGEVPALKMFCKIGGKETLASYGIGDREFSLLSNDDLIARMRAVVPQDHVDFLESLTDSVELGDYLFVHAGIRADVALEDQKTSDLRWIRRDFLDHDGDFGGRVVVHGHTVSEGPDVREHRIGIDTGAVLHGRLTAVGLEGRKRWFLSAADQA